MKRSAAALIASVSVVVPIAGCGGDDGGGSGGGRLSDALASVSAGAPADQSFAWTDVATVRKAGGFPDAIADLKLTAQQRRWLIPLGTGAARLAQYGIPLQEQIGIDTLAVDQALSIGQAPNMAVRLDGIDASAAADALQSKLGMKPAKLGDRDILGVGGEGEVDLRSEVGSMLVGIGNRAYAQDDTVALSGTDAALAAVLGDSAQKLGDDDTFAAAADCLGDVVSAEIHPGSEAGVDADVVAIGVRAGDPPTEVLCAVGSQADRMADALETNMAPDAVTRDTNQRLSTLVAKTDVDSGEADGQHYARAVLTPAEGRPLGFLTQALQRRTLGGFLGGGS